MRRAKFSAALILAGLLLSAPAAHAWDWPWKPSCTLPDAPPLPSADTPATSDTMKAYMGAYSDYLLAMNAYTQCMAAQAQSQVGVAGGAPQSWFDALASKVGSYF